MAKSIYNTLSEGTFEVVHIGNEIILNLPEWFAKAGRVFEDEQELLEWAREHEVVHSALQSGIQAFLITLRAIARPVVKTYKGVSSYNDAVTALGVNKSSYDCNDKNLTISKSIIADRNAAQERVNDAVWKIVAKPGTGKKPITTDQAIDNLASSDMSEEDMIALLRKKIAAKKQA